MMNNKGSSIIQILISIFLIGGIALGAFMIKNQQLKIARSSSYAFESLAILDEIKTILSDPRSCEYTFARKSPVNDVVKRISFFKNCIIKQLWWPQIRYL